MVGRKSVVWLRRTPVPSLENWEFQIIANNGFGAPVITTDEEGTIALKFGEGMTQMKANFRNLCHLDSDLSQKSFQDTRRASGHCACRTN